MNKKNYIVKNCISLTIWTVIVSINHSSNVWFSTENYKKCVGLFNIRSNKLSKQC